MSVIQFRKAAHRAPLDVVLADMGRGASLGVASPLISACDSPQQDHARGLEPAESIAEAFVCGGDALSGATGIGGWFIGACVTWSFIAAWWIGQ